MKQLSTNLLIILCILTASLFLSCRHSFKSKADVQKYINDKNNGLTDLYQKEDITVKLTWQPGQVLASKLDNQQKDGSVNATPEFSDNYFFILSLSKDNKELLRQLNYNLYSRMVQELSFHMQSYISIIADNKNPVGPIDCLFQQTYGASDANRLLIVFKKKDIGNATKLRISVQEFGLGLGNLNFYLETKNMDLINGLEYKNMKP